MARADAKGPERARLRLRGQGRLPCPGEGQHRRCSNPFCVLPQQKIMEANTEDKPPIMEANMEDKPPVKFLPSTHTYHITLDQLRYPSQYVIDWEKELGDFHVKAGKVGVSECLGEHNRRVVAHSGGKVSFDQARSFIDSNLDRPALVLTIQGGVTVGHGEWRCLCSRETLPAFPAAPPPLPPQLTPPPTHPSSLFPTAQTTPTITTHSLVACARCTSRLTISSSTSRVTYI